MEKVLKECTTPSGRKILLIVLDGIGDLPGEEGKTPLEQANTPHLDQLAEKSALGLHTPVAPGVTPGSGPGHLGLFGYDPVENLIGRGMLEAVGSEMDVTENDVAVRGNFCTAEEENGKLIIQDRRAGRIPTEKNRELIEKLRENIGEIDGVQVVLKTVMEHRFAVLFRFPHRVNPDHAMVSENDPQKAGFPEMEIKALRPGSQKTAEIARKFLREVRRIIGSEKPANYALLRGFSSKPNLTPFNEKYLLKAGAIATYPMYRGIAALAGMEKIPVDGNTIQDEVNALKENVEKFDFIFFHVKKTDSAGEDGDFLKKVRVIEEFDFFLPEILSCMNEGIIAITGDHSTPCPMKSHSWHPVPLLIHSPWVLGSMGLRFTERDCRKGELGFIKSREIMPLLLAHAGRLRKYGA